MNAPDVVRALYSSALGGDFDKFFGYLGDDLVLEEPAFLPYGGTHRGPVEFQRVLEAAQKILDLTSMTIVEIFGDESNATAVVEINLVANGQRKTVLEHWKVRDGKVRWGRVYWFDPALPA